MKPTICFATMCKNEEHCIRETLESVYKYIDTWVVCDTGSTDRTCEVVTEFFKEKGIPGELFVHEWEGFDVNKTKMFEACYNRADYILHLDADDLLEGEFEFTNEDAGCLSYHITVKRGSATFKCQGVFSCRHHWKLSGVAHTTIRCLDNVNNLPMGDLSHKKFHVLSRDTGARSQDPDKYYKDALRLQKQFFDTLVRDPDGLNSRSVFYTAQSYMDSGRLEEAMQWYSLYTKLKNTWVEEEFESHLRIGKCMIELKYPQHDIEYHLNKAIHLHPDRAEPYYVLGKYYNHSSKHTQGYVQLKMARSLSFEKAKEKYLLFVNKCCYGNYVNDELSVACYWTDRPEEGIRYNEEVYQDPEFEYLKPHLERNRQYFKDRYNM